jgi:hypothetical protein
MTLSKQPTKQQLREQADAAIARRDHWAAHIGALVVVRCKTGKARGASQRKKGRALPMQSWIGERWAVR